MFTRMARIVCACGLTGILSFAFQPSYAVPFTVNAADNFDPTGLFIPAGTNVAITATGEVNLALFDGPYITNSDGTILTAPPPGSGAFVFFSSQDPVGVPPEVGNKKFVNFNPEGFVQLIGAPYGALLAEFSTSPTPTQAADFNSILLIGSGTNFSSPGGFLSLSVNDINRFDNGGSYLAQVTTGVPEPSSLSVLMMSVIGFVLLLGSELLASVVLSDAADCAGNRRRAARERRR
jgi:hypothetical protein